MKTYSISDNDTGLKKINMKYKDPKPRAQKRHLWAKPSTHGDVDIRLGIRPSDKANQISTKEHNLEKRM